MRRHHRDWRQSAAFPGDELAPELHSYNKSGSAACSTGIDPSGCSLDATLNLGGEANALCKGKGGVNVLFLTFETRIRVARHGNLHKRLRLTNRKMFYLHHLVPSVPIIYVIMTIKSL